MSLREDILPRPPIARQAISAWENESVRGPILAFVAAFAFYELTQHPGFQVHNMHVWLADAFLRGRIDMPNAPRYIDWVMIGGKKYSHQGPLPAVLLMPFVAVWRLGFNLRHFGALMGGVVAAEAWILATRIGLRRGKRLLAWLFPVAGTSIWYEAKEGNTWGVAALCSVAFLALALVEYFGKRRPPLIGLAVGLAALCRPGASLTLIGFAVAFRKDWRDLLRLVIGAAGPGLLLVGWNYARAGSTISDRAYEIFYRHDGYSKQKPYGPFSLRYLPYNLYSWLFLVPVFRDGFPNLRPTMMGTGLPFTSPAFITAFAARRERWMWACIGLVLLPAGLFYGNGFSQFGMRYLLDTIPFFFAFICIALEEDRGTAYPLLLTLSIVANVFGVWYTNHHDLAP